MRRLDIAVEILKANVMATGVSKSLTDEQMTVLVREAVVMTDKLIAKLEEKPEVKK